MYNLVQLYLGTVEVVNRGRRPLHVPEGAVDTTIHLAHATIPFTEPNVSAALKNNTIVVALPTADGSGSVPEFTSAAQQKYVLVIPTP